MAFRADITVDWAASPRSITVAGPSTELTMQDLYDTLRTLAAQSGAMDEPDIIDASGKEPLGGGVLVGLTIKLLNAQVAFEARGGPSWVECNLTGGNLVAVDANGDPMSPVKPTSYVFIVKTASASATLQELSAIQFSSFNGGVTVDVTSLYSGTKYPIGTPQQPVNNLTDAVLIAQERGFMTFYITGNLTIDASGSYQGYSFIGQSQNNSILTISASANVLNCEFYEATVTGTLDGNCVIKNCKILDLDYIEGQVELCILGSGTIRLLGDANFLDCWSGVMGTGTPIIDMGAAGADLGIRNYNGGLKLINKSGSESVSIDLNSGKITLDSTITNGTIVVRGVGELEDNSTGTAQVISHYLVNPLNMRKYLMSTIEGLRPNHKGAGKVIYWDADAGDDTKDGISPETAVLTFAQAHNLAEDWGHNIISLVPKRGATTMITEPLNITKNYLFVRGMGFNAHLHPATMTPNGNLIDISGKGVEISGFHIEGINITAADCNGIHITGDHALIKDLTVEECTGHGIVIASANADDRTIIEGCVVKQNSKSGMQITAAVFPYIQRTHFQDNAEHGVDMTGAGATTDTFFANCCFHGNGGYGIKINNSNVADTIVEADCMFANNVSGNWLDSGTRTVIQSTRENTETADYVWNHADAAFILKCLKNKKELKKVGSVWYLIIYDDNGITEILNKALKDVNDANITDIASGVLGKELMTSV